MSNGQPTDQIPDQAIPSPASSRYLVVPRTLCFVLHEEEVLLIKRSPHRRLFPGKVNGLGGHVEQGEDVVLSAQRELVEEAGLEVTDLWLAGVVHVDGRLGQASPLAGNIQPGVLIFVFTAQADSRVVRASEEGDLIWVALSDVEELDWVDGDPVLLLQALAARASGRPFSATIGLEGISSAPPPS